MKGLPWGPLYDKHSVNAVDTDALEAEIAALFQGRAVTRKRRSTSTVRALITDDLALGCASTSRQGRFSACRPSTSAAAISPSQIATRITSKR